jgi:hypothetical protein
LFYKEKFLLEDKKMARRGTHVGVIAPFRIATTYGWYIGATQVTSSAAELNKLTGITSNVGELNLVDGLTGLINATNTGYTINWGTIASMSATKFSVTHGCSSTTGLRVFFQLHPVAAAIATFYDGYPRLFTWTASGTTFNVYGWTDEGSVATKVAPVEWLAIGPA